MVAAAVIGAGIGGALISSSASSSAANGQQDAANNATQLQQQQYNQTRADQQPYRDAGYGALSKLQTMLGVGTNTGAAGFGSLSTPFTGASVATDPGYQFGLTQGTQAATRAANAQGRQYSGATLKALSRYGNDYATTKFDDAFNRNQSQNNQLYNQLAGVSGTGQIATNQVGSIGQQTANNVGNIGIGNSNAQGANAINQGNIFSNGVNQGLSAWQRYTGQGGSVAYGSPYNDNAVSGGAGLTSNGFAGP